MRTSYVPWDMQLENDIAEVSKPGIPPSYVFSWIGQNYWLTLGFSMILFMHLSLVPIIIVENYCVLLEGGKNRIILELINFLQLPDYDGF